MAFDTSIRDEAVRQEKIRREHLRSEVVARTLSALGSLAVEFGIGEAYIFGSAARSGAYREDSDVDIAVDADPVQIIRLAARISRLVGRDALVLELDESYMSERAKREGIRWTPLS